MKEFDQIGFMLCELQAKTFERSVDFVPYSSELFINRFMNSEIITLLDNTAILFLDLWEQDFLDRVEEEYGKSSQDHSIKYSKNKMFWMGYIYRYFSYTYQKTSKEAYKIMKPKELKQVYLGYHTMDPAQAIERILEAKELDKSVI